MIFCLSMLKCCAPRRRLPPRLGPVASPRGPGRVPPGVLPRSFFPPPVPGSVTQRQVQRIRKGYEETGDVFDKPRSGRPRKTTGSGGPFVGSKIQGQPLFHCSRAPRDLVTWSPCVNQNSLSNSVSKWPPWSNQCPETSTEQKTIKKPCGFCQGPQPAKRMDAWKVAEGGFLRWIFCWITSQLPQILQETYWSPHGSEIHPENSHEKNHGLGLHPVWGCARDVQGGRQHQ